MEDKLPPPIQVTRVEKYSEKSDPPMVDLKITNPVSYFKKWVGKFLNNQDIDLRLRIKPFATIGLSLAFTAVGTAAFSTGRYLFPNSSPLLHRQITYQGVIQQSQSGKYLLTLADNTIWTLRPKAQSSVNFQNIPNGQALVKGNLGKENFVIEVSEITTLNPLPEASFAPSPSSPARLPELYPNLSWEKTEKKVLIFTSGKRKIEQEGVYLESTLITSFPQDFINYYLGELKDKGFKETLNSVHSEGIMITYAKEGSFLTFGIKNTPSGYKAYLEHN